MKYCNIIVHIIVTFMDPSQDCAHVALGSLQRRENPCLAEIERSWSTPESHRKVQWSPRGDYQSYSRTRNRATCPMSQFDGSPTVHIAPRQYFLVCIKFWYSIFQSISQSSSNFDKYFLISSILKNFLTTKVEFIHQQETLNCSGKCLLQCLW